MMVTGSYCLGGEINNGLEVVRYKISECQGVIAVKQLEPEPVFELIFSPRADTFVTRDAWLDPLPK